MMDKTRKDALLRLWRNNVCNTSIPKPLPYSLRRALFTGFLLGKGCSVEESNNAEFFQEADVFINDPGKEIW